MKTIEQIRTYSEERVEKAETDSIEQRVWMCMQGEAELLSVSELLDMLEELYGPIKKRVDEKDFEDEEEEREDPLKLITMDEAREYILS